MFGFTEEEAEQLGTEGRFSARERKFINKEKPLPVVQHRFWWVVHNCMAHMALGILPCRATFSFHDWTSRKLNAE